jgi:crotonobetainyl-CoA:carnitine CoA-transferase CaiB-like acyl-CoA transferase
VLYKLAKNADVFVSNYELSVLDNLGANYETLKEMNPGIIYGVINGYGMTGPDKDERGFDYSAAWARSGIMHMLGEPGSIPPPQRGGLIDRTVGTYMVAGVLAALLHRQKTGEGQCLNLSLYQTAVWTNAEDIQSVLAGQPTQKHVRTRAVNPLWNEYETKDGRWFWLAMLQPDQFWPGFCRAIGKPELEGDPLYNGSAVRWENCEKLIKIIDEIIIGKTLADWEKIFRANNVIYGVVATPTEVVNDPQAIVNNFFVDLHHTSTDMKTVATPVNFVQNPGSVRAPAPEVGEHTEEILLELGYDWEAIADMKDRKIIL